MSDKITEAHEFARKAHEGQFRKNGTTPYINHPVAVASLVRDWIGYTDTQCDDIVIAAVLHDVIEERPDLSIDYISDRFGSYVGDLVRRLTFTGKTSEEKQAYLDAMGINSDGAWIVKAADRICNVRDFIDSGNIEYAYKYFHKADIFFSHYHYHTQFHGATQAMLEHYALNLKLNTFHF